MKKQMIAQLIRLKEQYGEAIFSEHKRLLGFMKDYFPFAKHEHYLLKLTLPLALYAKFKSVTVADYLKCRNRHIYQLEKEEGLSHQWAEEAVDFWLDLVKKDLGQEALFSQDHSLEEKLKEATACKQEEPKVFNNISALLHKANCYYNGEGIKEDRKEALKWYEKAAAMGSVEAMNYVGNIYYMGEGVPKNIDLALNWYLKAAAAGSGTAMNYIGNMYYEGKGVTKDIDEARKWYNQAVARGNYRAMFNLGYIYYEKAISKGKITFEEGLRAAQEDELDAMYFVAYSYHWGLEIAQDYEEAFKWYEKLAGKGEKAAMIWLAYMFFNGQGVEKNLEEAKKWCEKAIKISE